jgi:hypothetical protein
MPVAEAARRRCRAPAGSARRGHEGRVSGESRGEGEFTHELVVALLLGACARSKGREAVLGSKGRHQGRKKPSELG